MKRRSTPLVLLVAAGLGLTLSLPASGTPTASTTVQGLATDGGRAVGGAAVELFEDLDVPTTALNSGYEVASDRVATATTDSSGRFTFSVPVAQTGKSYRNFHVVITSNTNQTVEFFTTGNLAGSVRVAAPTRWFARPTKTKNQSSSSPAAICTPTLMRQDVPNQETVVSNIFLLTGDVGVYGTVSQSSTSKLGVGVGSPGAGFSASGSRSASTQNIITMGVRAHAERQLFETYSVYEYQYYSKQCNRTGYHNYMVPKFLQGGTAVKNVAAPSLPYCSKYLPGDKDTINRSSAHSFGGGVATSGKIGINLSAQTGWTSSASITYFTNYSGGMYVCGEGNYPGQPNSGMNGAYANYPPGSCHVSPAALTGPAPRSRAC